MLDREQRTTFAALADVLIPSANGMPSASEVGVEGKWLERVLTARPDLEPGVVLALAAAAGDDPAEELRRRCEDDPDSFGALALAVSGAYYMHLKIRKRIGYPGQKHDPPFPGRSGLLPRGRPPPPGPRARRVRQVHACVRSRAAGAQWVRTGKGRMSW